MGVTYKYFGAPDRATAARVPPMTDPVENHELLSSSHITNVKPETLSAMVFSLLGNTPMEAAPPLELVVLHPAHAVMQLPPALLSVLRDATDEQLGAAAFIWSTVPDRRIPRDAYLLYRMLHDWTTLAHELHDAGHQLYCLMHS